MNLPATSKTELKYTTELTKNFLYKTNPNKKKLHFLV